MAMLLQVNQEDISERRELYTAASPMGCEIPELVAFLQESKYQGYKEIHFDHHQVSSDGRCAMENCVLDHSTISSLLNSDVDKDSNVLGEPVDKLKSLPNGAVPVTEHDCIKRGVKECDSGSLSEDTRVKTSTSAKNTCTQTSNSDEKKGESEISEDPDEETVLPTNSLVTEAASTSVATTRSMSKDDGGKCPGNANLQQLLKADDHNISRLEGGTSEDVTALSLNQNSIGTRDHGECSFSAAIPPSRLQVDSASGTCAGSTSFRSNSSNASKRSFAFPILPSEWDDSPIRMARATRKHMRRRPNWWMCVLCCKF